MAVLHHQTASCIAALRGRRLSQLLKRHPLNYCLFCLQLQHPSDARSVIPVIMLLGSTLEAQEPGKQACAPVVSASLDVQ